MVNPGVRCLEKYSFDSELKEQKLVRNLVRSGDIVFDIGAHYGKYTKLFSLLVGKKGRVFAFEPTPESYQKLKSEIGSAGINNVTLENKAVFSEDTILKFNQFPENYSSWNGIGSPQMKNPDNYRQIVQHTKTIEVPAVSIDSYLKRIGIQKIDYLKLDVEGAEIFALAGMEQLLRAKVIKYLQFEISKKMLEGLNTEASKVFYFLSELGYNSYQITEEGSIGSLATDSDSYYENYISIPKSEAKTLSSLKEIKELELQEYNSHETENREDFLENGLWTPQTLMLRKIQDIVEKIEGKPANALSIDKNPELERILKRKWQGLDILIAKYPEYDAQDLSSFEDETFDLVFSHQVLEHIPKPWIAAKEMNRVLKRGGVGIHTTCAYNPRHGYPHFKDYYRFLPDGLTELFDNITIWEKDGWGNKQALIYNLTIDDGHGKLGGRRFLEAFAKNNDEDYPWVTWIVFQKKIGK